MGSEDTKRKTGRGSKWLTQFKVCSDRRWVVFWRWEAVRSNSRSRAASRDALQQKEGQPTRNGGGGPEPKVPSTGRLKSTCSWVKPGRQNRQPPLQAAFDFCPLHWRSRSILCGKASLSFGPSESPWGRQSHQHNNHSLKFRSSTFFARLVGLSIPNSLGTDAGGIDDY